MINAQSFKGKRIEEIIEVVSGDILDYGDGKKVDAIVNAAKPTLMGGSGVDGAIHSRMDELSGKQAALNEIIREEIDKGADVAADKVRCDPGKAVTTKGHAQFAKYIIHAVGPKYDGGSECIQVLKHCYESIMEQILDNPYIKKVAVPLISSGNYGFPIKLAFRVALTTIGNCLIECKSRDFDKYSRIEKIYIVVYNERSGDLSEIEKVYADNEWALREEKRMVNVGVARAQYSYLREIWRFDTEKRYYFTITKMVRWLLAACRFLFFPSLLTRHWAGKRGWKFRREIIEIETIIRMLIPIFFVVLIQIVQNINGTWIDNHTWFLAAACGVTAYTMADTITCLLGLIFLADIQGPSANQLRTIILLSFNYIEMIFGIALFYYTYYWGKIQFLQALDYSLLGKELVENVTYSMPLRMIAYARTGIEFLFVVLTFAFFVAHLKQRKYLSDLNVNKETSPSNGFCENKKKTQEDDEKFSLKS